MKKFINSGQFKKGQVPWIKGKKGVIKNPLKGKKMPEVWKAKLRKPKNWSYVPTLEHRKKVGDSHRGKKSVNWKGGITPWHETIRSSMEYKLWRKSVFERDNWTCQECGDNKGGNLQAHHIKPFSSNPELHFAIDNGLTLCIRCHAKTESYGGKQTYINLKQKAHA